MEGCWWRGGGRYWFAHHTHKHTDFHTSDHRWLRALVFLCARALLQIISANMRFGAKCRERAPRSTIRYKRSSYNEYNPFGNT